MAKKLGKTKSAKTPKIEFEDDVMTTAPSKTTKVKDKKAKKVSPVAVSGNDKQVDFYTKAYKAGKKYASSVAKSIKGDKKTSIQGILELTGAKGKDIKTSLASGYQNGVKDVLGNLF